MTQSKKDKEKKVQESVVKHLEQRMGKQTVDNPHFQSFISTLVRNEMKVK